MVGIETDRREKEDPPSVYFFVFYVEKTKNRDRL